MLNDTNDAVSASADVYLRIGDHEILLAEGVKGVCDPKTHTECMSVCCLLPERNDAESMKLIIKSTDDYSNEYVLKYNCNGVPKKIKMLNTV